MFLFDFHANGRSKLANFTAKKNHGSTRFNIYDFLANLLHRLINYFFDQRKTQGFCTFWNIHERSLADLSIFNDGHGNQCVMEQSNSSSVQNSQTSPRHIQNYKLIPHPVSIHSTTHVNEFFPSVSCKLESDTLLITYVLAGPLGELKIPQYLSKSYRADKLWEATCFEFFTKQQNQKTYWEFNFSPTHAWNAYHFSDYRMNRREDQDFLTSISSSRNTEEYQLRVSCQHPNFFSQSFLCQFSIILEDKLGQKSFWAVNHKTKLPDFHHPDGLFLYSI